MNKSTIQKSVDEANAKALAAYEQQVASFTTAIQTARANIESYEKQFTQNVAAQATSIAQNRANMAKLVPPVKVTAEDIFGAEIVASATE